VNGYGRALEAVASLPVKPFNFPSAFQQTSCSDESFIDEIEPTATTRRRKGAKQTLRPIAPYSRDPVEALLFLLGI
jgi:hypothetical protein